MHYVEITLKIDKVLGLGYNKLYVNVDNLENGSGFLRLLAMQKSEYLIVYEATLPLDKCYQILDELEKSEYDIKDFTVKWDVD